MVLMEITTLKVDRQGRIMLPSKWRRHHGVVASTEIRITEREDGSLTVETYEQSIRRAQDLVRRYVPEGVSLVNELLADRRTETDRERSR